MTTSSVASKSSEPRLSRGAGNSGLRALAPVIGVAVAVAIISPFILGDGAWLDTSITLVVFAILAVSLSLCYGLGGMLSFAQATFASLGAYSTAILTARWDLSPWLGVVAAIIVPAILAYVLARLIVRLSPLALALATLAFSQLVTLVINGGGDFTGGYIGITGIPSLAPFKSTVSLHFFGWVLVILALLVLVRVRRSMRGRALLALSTDNTLASANGIAVNSQRAATFALAGAMAGVAGWYYAHSRAFLAPTSLDLDMSFMIAIAVIIGGRRTILGPIIGTIIMVLLRDYVPGEESHGMFYGGALILVLLLFPEGVMGENWKARFRRKGSGSRAPAPPEESAEVSTDTPKRS